MAQKIISIGNSVGLIIPKSLLEKADLTSGSEVDVEVSPQGKGLVIIKKGDKRNSIDPHFLEVLKRINEKYGSALKELANK
jgi:putative addiction module antidote